VKIHIKDNKVYSENWNSPGGYCVHTPVPTPVHTGIEEVKGEVKGEGEPPPTTAFSSSSPDIQAERIFAAVTGFPTFPGTGRDDAIAAINALKNRHGDELVTYLKPFWLACKKRYPGNVRVFWLTDWAIAGVIPDGKKPQPEGPDLSKWSPA
jgi:hypothetical protein